MYSFINFKTFQLGDVNYAQDCFSKAAAISSENPQHVVEENINKYVHVTI